MGANRRWIVLFLAVVLLMSGIALPVHPRNKTPEVLHADVDVVECTEEALSSHEQAVIEEIIEVCSDAIKRDPENANLYNNRGNLYLILNDHEFAFADFDKAIELEPDYASAYNNRGVAFRRIGLFEQAIADFDQAIELDPDFVEACSNRGIAYLNIGAYQQAIADFDQAIALNPDFAEAYLNRGLACRQLEKYDLALDDFDYVLDQDPESPIAYLGRGMIYLTAEGYQNCRRARNDLERFLELAPEHQRAPDIQQVLDQLCPLL